MKDQIQFQYSGASRRSSYSNITKQIHNTRDNVGSKSSEDKGSEERALDWPPGTDHVALTKSSVSAALRFQSYVSYVHGPTRRAD